jgi:virulence factor Mce-like protein
MRSRRSPISEIFDNPMLVGTVTLLVVLVAVYISYIAENGLPFVPTYDVNVQVADGGELVKNADVRIGGARVGQVLTIKPEPAESGWPHPYTVLGLALDRSLEPLPMDTHYQVRLSSVLGGQYLELFPGKDDPRAKGSPAGLPDGGTFRLSTNAKLDHDIGYVDLSSAFDTFGPKTRQGLRSVTNSLGDALAGRGVQINDSIAATRQLLGPLDNVLRVLSTPSTSLSGFIAGLAGTTSALAPVAPTISALLSDGATTFRALDRPALGQTLDALPGTEATATAVLTNSLPVLRDAAEIVQALKPAAAILPTAARRLDAVLRAAPATFRLVGPVAIDLGNALKAVRALASDPASTETFSVLGSSDLGTFGASVFVGLGAILDTVAPAQLSCNITGLWLRNFASGLSEGDSTGNWLRFLPVTDVTQLTQTATPSSDLHINSYPVEDSSQCQAGNEVYKGAQAIDDPGQTSAVVDNTTPPPGVLAEGRKAGLVP